MINARENFRTSTLGKGWQSVVDSTQFEAAVMASLLHMQAGFGHTPDMATSAMVQKKMEGALQFLTILSNLTASETPATKPIAQNLDHRI